MANPKVDQEVVERNVRLTGEIIKYVMSNPKVLDVLPEKFELVYSSTPGASAMPRAKVVASPSGVSSPRMASRAGSGSR